MGQWLSERLRQSFVIDNRPGASTNIAIETVAKATPDGYMLGMVGTGAAINAALYEYLDYDLVRDWAHMTRCTVKRALKALGGAK
jgi:tripartite-type tricarboxylate transporter receptor subunit TctC